MVLLWAVDVNQYITVIIIKEGRRMPNRINHENIVSWFHHNISFHKQRCLKLCIECGLYISSIILHKNNVESRSVVLLCFIYITVVTKTIALL